MQEIIKRIKNAIAKIEVAKPEDKKIRSIAERLLSIANAMGDMPPDATQAEQLRGLHTELAAAMARYPSPKRKEFSPEDFQAFATKALEAAGENTEQIAAVESLVKQASEQIANGASMIGIEIAEDPSGSELASLTDQINKLSDALKGATADFTKNPFEDDKEKPGMKAEGKKPACKTDEQAPDLAPDQTGQGSQPDQPREDTTKSAWPRDLNIERKPSEVERWGTRKSLSDQERSFGPDPIE